MATDIPAVHKFEKIVRKRTTYNIIKEETYLSRICSQCSVRGSSEAVEADVGVVGVEVDHDAEQLSGGKVYQEPD